MFIIVAKESSSESMEIDKGKQPGVASLAVDEAWTKRVFTTAAEVEIRRLLRRSNFTSRPVYSEYVDPDKVQTPQFVMTQSGLST